jgi:hypothetical protein
LQSHDSVSPAFAAYPLKDKSQTQKRKLKRENKRGDNVTICRHASPSVAALCFATGHMQLHDSDQLALARSDLANKAFRYLSFPTLKKFDP